MSGTMDFSQESAGVNQALQGDAGLGQQPAGESDAQAAQAAWQAYQNSPALQQAIAENFSSDAWMLSQPGLGAILVGAAINQWDQGRMEALLTQNPWWQQNGSRVAAWNALTSSDPAGAQAQVAASKAQLETYAQSVGVNMTDSALTNLATTSAMLQWNQDQMVQALRASYSPPTAVTGYTGDTATMASQVRAVGGQYLQQMGSNDVAFWVTAGVKQGMTPQQLTDEMSNFYSQQAAQRFPWMKAALSMGMTPQQYLQPYTTQAAQTLSISPTSVNWTDPKWQAALLQTGQDGQQTPVNADQFARNIMRDPTFGYGNTQAAVDKAYSTVQQLAQTMGKMG